MMKEEMVLVVRRALFDQLGAFQGLSFEADRYLPNFLAREHNFFVPRSFAEHDPSLKQIIPYAIVTHGGKVLRYRRGKKSGEQRLVAKGSIGIGGHMNEADEGLFTLDEAAYLAGVKREITEEIVIPEPVSNRVVALINDDSTEVGRVHIGIVHKVELPTPEATKRETVILGLEFLTPERLRAERETLETWSQICLDHLERILDACRVTGNS